MRFRASVLALPACFLLLPGTVAAQGNCSTHTVQGTYAAASTGFSGPYPLTVLGTVKIASDGQAVAGATLVTPAGAVYPTIYGALSVSPDCRALADYGAFQ